MAGELKWRAPKIPATTTNEAPANADRPTPVSESNAVRKVSHDQEQQKANGPELISSGDHQRQKEPRKLRSVVVKRSSPVRPLNEEQPSPEDGRREPTLRDENVLRTATGASGSSSWRFPQRDPFEEDQDWKTRPQRDGGASQLRLAQGDEEASTRSVLVRDPFEEDAGAPRTLQSSPRDRFTGQPMPLNGAGGDGDAEQEIPQPEGFRPFTDEPFSDDYSEDRSLEAERARAERVCTQALERLEQDRITTVDLAIQVPGEVGVDLPFECALDTSEYEPRNWPGITYMWKASALCHKPLYFENVALERYGHSWGWHVQPLVSAAHFFATVPILPYKMGLTPPNECIYALGYYRPGNCAPYLIEPLGTSPRAVVWQAGAVVGAAAIVP